MEEEGYNFMKILSIQEATEIAKGKKSVVITGVTGQDGSFMSDLLLRRTNYEIFGGARRLSVSNHENIDHLKNEPRFHLINFDLTDAHSINKTVSCIKPLYFINFAAQSFVKSSWDFPEQTWNTNTTGVLSILESIHHNIPTCRFYNAGSSEEFGDTVYSPQNEKHPLRPRSPYGASKAAVRQLVKVYRESYGLYAIQGWLFNHEGTRRGEEFVTRKITKEIARLKEAYDTMKTGDPNPEPMELGNINAARDWSDAEDCVEAVWRMLNQDEYNPNIRNKIPNPGPDGYLTPIQYNSLIVPHIKEYVVGSGESHSIREFVQIAMDTAGLTGCWWENGELTDYKMPYNGGYAILAKINPAYYRPADVETLCSDSSLIRKELGWQPKTSFKQLIEKMVEHDISLLPNHTVMIKPDKNVVVPAYDYLTEGFDPAKLKNFKGW